MQVQFILHLHASFLDMTADFCKLLTKQDPSVFDGCTEITAV